jgi:hypothetical protein
VKLKIFLTCVFAAGIAASMAVAKPPSGHGRADANAKATGHAAGATTDTTTTGTTATTGNAGKVLVCHTLPNGHYVVINVSARSAPARGKHGDVPFTGSCPGPIQGHTPTTASTTTTVGTTATTTSTDTTIATTTTTP